MTTFTNLSQTCLGPSYGTGHFVSEKCPNNTTIDFDTARYIVARTNGRLILDNRCVQCRNSIRITTLLSSCKMEFETWNTNCAIENCLQPSNGSSGKCIEHLFS